MKDSEADRFSGICVVFISKGMVNSITSLEKRKDKRDKGGRLRENQVKERKAREKRMR